MKPQKQYSIWAFIFFPALAMMLGWGLRGHIGGGPFGAMIPGAMVTLSLGLLLRLPVSLTSVLVVFGVFGIGLGGEMTYGQTLGFLRNTDTVWWGLSGTTLKGSVWGLLGGTVLALGFVYDRIPKKTLLIGLLLMMLGFLVGYKLINDPMILYFSDPEKPRVESWAGLLLGAITLLFFMKSRISAEDFSVLRRFAIYGLIGGGLGFGLGSIWITVGSQWPDVIFKGWWKAMEFSFGFLLGGALGWAAYNSRKEIERMAFPSPAIQKESTLPFVTELTILAVLALLIHAVIPYSLEPFINAAGSQDEIITGLLRDLARQVTGYGFYGFIFILVIIRFPEMTWQIGITLTFAHASIDLIRDFYPDRNIWSPFTMHFLYISSMTLVVGMLTAYLRRRHHQKENLFLLLIWSCIVVSLLRMFFFSGSLSLNGLSIIEILFRRFFVDLAFLVFAVILTWIVFRFRRRGSDF